MRFGALAERPFRLLWLGRTASAVGDSLAPVALAFAVLHIGGGASGIGFVLASFSGAQIAFLLIGGVWADRLPRPLVMLGCDALRGAVDVFVAVMLLTGVMRLWMFVVSAGIFGAASAFFLPASAGLVPETVGDARLQEANAPAVALAERDARARAARLGRAGRDCESRLGLRHLAEGWREVLSRSWLVAGLSARSAASQAGPRPCGCGPTGRSSPVLRSGCSAGCPCSCRRSRQSSSASRSPRSASTRRAATRSGRR